MDVWYNVAKTIVGAYVALFIGKVHVDGRENIPTGPKIVVANHALASDSFILPWIFPEKLHGMIQADLFSLPILGKLLALADQIPVVKGRGIEAFEAAKEKLSLGETVVLFPEGRLNDGKGLQKAFSGAARLTLESGAPLVPVGFYTPPQFARPITWRRSGHPAHGSWQFGGPCFISVGEMWRPLLETPRENLMAYNRMVHDLTEDIMGRINLLIERARDYATTWFPNINQG